MNPIHHTVFNREIDSSLDENISIKKKGAYLLRISASARSWWQNNKFGRSFLQKDSLTFFIDKKQIFPAFLKKRLRADDIWNGNVLKGHELTVYILFALDEGNHTLSFDVHGKPYLGELSVSQVSGPDITMENLECSSRDRIPWITFLIGQAISLSSFSIAAKAEKSGKEDDDLRLVIDGMTQKNEEGKAHQEWYWCGKILQGKSKTFTRSFTDGQSSKRFDLIADGAPHIVKLFFKTVDGEHVGSLRNKTGRVIWDEIMLRSQPSTSAKTVLILSRKQEFELRERAVKGEVPKNEKGVLLGSDRWHKVRVEEKEGYIFSQGVELEGEDPKTIRNIIIQKARAFDVDPCLIAAIAEQESKLFPYAVSQNKAQGIFQLKEGAVQDVNRIYEKHFTNRFSLLENIDAGILYYKYLRDQYASSDRLIEQSLAAWNWGMGNISKTGTFSLSLLPQETQNFIQSVLQKRKHCNRRSGKNVSSAIIIAIILFSIISLVSFSVRSESVTNDAISSFIQALVKEDILNIIEERSLDFDGDGKEEHFYLARFRTPLTSYTILYQSNDGPLRAFPHRDDGILTWSIGDVNQNDTPDVLIHFGYSGSAGFGTLAIYEWSDVENRFKKIFWRSDIASTFGFRNVDQSTYADELVYFYNKRKWEGRDHQAIYRWNDDANIYDLFQDE